MNGMPALAKKKLKGNRPLARKWREQKRRCYWCERKVSMRELTREHVTPVSRGGGNGCRNIVLACRDCNGGKGSMTGDEWREWITEGPRCYA